MSTLTWTWVCRLFYQFRKSIPSSDHETFRRQFNSIVVFRRAWVFRLVKHGYGLEILSTNAKADSLFRTFIKIRRLFIFIRRGVKPFSAYLNFFTKTNKGGSVAADWWQVIYCIAICWKKILVFFRFGRARGFTKAKTGFSS